MSYHKPLLNIKHIETYNVPKLKLSGLFYI